MVAFLGTIATSWAQEKQYILLEGTLGKYPIVMSLHQEEWQFEIDEPNIKIWAGDYYYKSQERPISIGESDRIGNEIIFNSWEFEKEEDIETFRGIFEKGQYKGTWHKGNQTLPFELNESKSHDFTEIQRFQAERIVPTGMISHDYPIEGKFSIDFYLPKDAQLQKELVEKIFPDYSNFEEFSKFQLDSMENDYKGILAEFKEDQDILHFMNYETMHNFTPYLNTQNYLVMNYFGYEYTGGAHGMSWEKYLTYDKRKNKWIELKDVLDLSKPNEINKVLDKVLRKEYNFPSKVPLTEPEDSFFLADKIEYSENFVLSKKGITFHYGLYEMTPYAYGFFQLFVPYEELKPYLKKDFKY